MQYDLCAFHADRLSVPRGWDLVDLRALAPVAPILPLTGWRAS